MLARVLPFHMKKLNKMTCAPSALRSAWAATLSDQFSLSTRRNHSSLATHWVYSEGWSDWADTYVDLIFPWEPSHFFFFFFFFVLFCFVFFVMRWLIYGKLSRPNIFEPTGAVAQLLERPFCVREVVGSIPGRVIPKTFKMVLAALSFAFSTEKAELSVWCQYNVTGWNVTSCVWGGICQWGSILKVSIELPVTSRHRRDDWKIVESDVKSE